MTAAWSFADATSRSPAELQALLQSEIKRWGEVIRCAGVEPE